MLLPRITAAVPSPLVAIVVLTTITVAAAIAVPEVGDKGELPDSLPTLGLPDVPYTFETLKIIAPYALAMALVGLMESLMTAKLVDDITDTPSDKTRESWGQGVANIVTGFFGGMGGCAMIGQTMINVKVSRCPHPALDLPRRRLPARPGRRSRRRGRDHPDGRAGRGDGDGRRRHLRLAQRSSRRRCKRMPKSETTVMLATVAVTVATENLAIGVGVGVLTAMVLFARRVAHFAEVDREVVEDRRRAPTAVYTVSGELFFASSNDLYEQFEYADDPERVVIDLTDSHVWDASTVAALDAVTTKYAARGRDGRHPAASTPPRAAMHDRLSGQLSAHCTASAPGRDLGPRGVPGLDPQPHAGLGRGAVALALVARATGGDGVEPRPRPTARARQEVVDRVGPVPAVGAAVPLARQHAVPGVARRVVEPLGRDVAHQPQRRGPLVGPDHPLGRAASWTTATSRTSILTACWKLTRPSGSKEAL